MALEVGEFMRRFLLHVLPDKFIRIRHFGFLGNRFKKENIQKARTLLKSPQQIEVKKDESWQELLMRVTGHDLTKCPACEKGKMIQVQSILPHHMFKRKIPKVDTS